MAVRECGDEDVTAGRGPGQVGWYQFARAFVRGKSVLDVGCGLGYGMDILRGAAASVAGQDLDSRLARPGVLIGGLEEVADKAFDVVVSVEVIEHVPCPPEFLGHLARIAREAFFLTTPNWTASRCRWPYHLREYTPREFEALLAPYGEVVLYKGDPQGNEVYPVRRRAAYHAFNAARNWSPTGFAARCANYLVPRRWRIHSQNAAWVCLPGRAGPPGAEDGHA